MPPFASNWLIITLPRGRNAILIGHDQPETPSTRFFFVFFKSWKTFFFFAKLFRVGSDWIESAQRRNRCTQSILSGAAKKLNSCKNETFFCFCFFFSNNLEFFLCHGTWLNNHSCIQHAIRNFCNEQVIKNGNGNVSS